MKRWIAALVLAGAATAAAPEFFDGLADHPSLQAARANLQAYAYEAAYAGNPVALDTSGGYSYRSLDEAEPCPFLSDPDPTNDLLCQLVSPDVPSEVGQAEVGLTLRAFPYGDLADRVALAEINLRTAELDYQSARAKLERSALDAALKVRLAEKGLELAREGEALAENALEATRLRHAKGTASDRELRDAERALEEARLQRLSAEENLELARAQLAQFTSAAPPAWPWPSLEPPAEAEAPEVTKARLRIEQARVGEQRSLRSFWPVGEVRYQHNLDDYNAVGVSVESRTLGTRIYYNHQSYADLTRSRTQDEWRVGLRLNISADTWSGYEAARARLEGAQAGLEAAQRQAELERQALELRITQSERARELARRAEADARTNYEETARRVELGLEPPLAAQKAWVDAARAELERMQAEHDAVRARLDLLVYLAVPPSEVWK